MQGARGKSRVTREKTDAGPSLHGRRRETGETQRSAARVLPFPSSFKSGNGYEDAPDPTSPGNVPGFQRWGANAAEILAAPIANRRTISSSSASRPERYRQGTARRLIRSISAPGWPRSASTRGRSLHGWRAPPESSQQGRRPQGRPPREHDRRRSPRGRHPRGANRAGARRCPSQISPAPPAREPSAGDSVCFPFTLLPAPSRASPRVAAVSPGSRQACSWATGWPGRSPATKAQPWPPP